MRVDYRRVSAYVNVRAAPVPVSLCARICLPVALLSQVSVIFLRQDLGQGGARCRS
jgi:hypothetical protein